MKSMKILRVVLLGTFSLVGVSAFAFAQVPTFNKDVAPLVYERCATCHRPGEVAPMSLLSYKQARPWARAIKAKVAARQMPPWFASPDSPKMRNAQGLTQAQIDMLVAWVDGGAPEGAEPAPEPPKFTGGVNAAMHRAPDYVLESPDWVEIPATAQIPLVDMWSPSPFKEDTYFEAVEVRPLNRAVTHHLGVLNRILPPGATVGSGPAWKGGPTINGMLTLGATRAETRGGANAFEGAGRPRGASGTYTAVLGTYAPAGGFFRYPPGMAKRMGPDRNYLNWNTHYTGTGKPEKGRETVSLWVTQGPVTQEVYAHLTDDVEIANGKELLGKSTTFGIGGTGTGAEFLNRPNIQPSEANYTIVSMTAFDSPVTIMNFWPHMHLRGKSMKFVAAYPDGHEELLLNVPNYQFDWQLFYSLEKPIKLPAGTIVRTEAVFDNSLKNRQNPSPQTEVVWGNMSWEEMHFPFVELTLDDNNSQPLNRRTTGSN